MKLKILVLMLLLASISGCIEGPIFGTVPVLHVRVEVGGTTENPIIESVEAEQGTIDTLRRVGRHLPVEFPGVHVTVLKNGHFLNYWTTVAYDGPGTYELTAEFETPPAPGDVLRVIVEVMGLHGVRGYPINQTTVAITWE